MEEVNKQNGSGDDQVVKLQAERDEYLAGWQRAKADFINYKREEAKRLEEVAKYGVEDFMYELITVIDTFNLGIASLEKHGPVDRGVYMIKAQLEDILKRRGLQKIDISPGDEFDPLVAEAIAAVESDIPEGHIVEEIEPGYRLHEKVIRAARVKVSKGIKQA